MKAKNVKGYRNWLAIDDNTFVCIFANVVREDVAFKKITNCLGKQNKIIAIDNATARTLIEKGTERIYIG